MFVPIYICTCSSGRSRYESNNALLKFCFGIIHFKQRNVEAEIYILSYACLSGSLCVCACVSTHRSF